MNEVFPRKQSMQEEALDIAYSALEQITEKEKQFPEPEVLTKE